MNMDLAFVVGCATAKEIAATNGGFERGRGPELERFGRLHIVMPVEENRGLPRGFQRLGVNERVQVRRNNFHSFESRCAQMIGNPARAPLNIRLMLALGTDAWDAQEFVQFGKVLVARTVNELSKIHRRPSGDRSPVGFACQLPYAKFEA